MSVVVTVGLAAHAGDKTRAVEERLISCAGVLHALVAVVEQACGEVASAPGEGLGGERRLASRRALKPRPRRRRLWRSSTPDLSSKMWRGLLMFQLFREVKLFSNCSGD